MPEFDPKPTRRCVLIAGAASMLQVGTLSAAAEPVVTVHRDPNCGCCSGLGAAPAESRISDQGPGNQGPRCGEDAGSAFPTISRPATRRKSRAMSSKDMFRPSRSSVFLPTSRTQPALPCPACRSAPPAWRAASRSRTRSCCLGRPDDAPTCVSLGRRRLIEAVAQTGLKRNEVANLFAPCGHCQRVQRASVDRVPGQQRVGQLHRLFITLEALVR